MSDKQLINNAVQIKTYNCTDSVEGCKKLYLNTKSADVYFSFGSADGTVKRVAAHKNILAAISDVFDAMFYGELKESGDVHITDATEAAFIEFLQSVYLTKVKLTMENIADVMHLGNKYQMPNCVNVCVEFLKDTLTVDNIFFGLSLAILYDQKELLKFCQKFIEENTAKVFKTNGFLQCDKQAIEYILKIDKISCSEVEVFKACMAWVQQKSKQDTLSKAMVEKHLGDLYYEIRFASMTMPQLCTLLTEYESVLQNDFVTITKMITQPTFQAEKFNKNPRQPKWNTEAIVECDLRLRETLPFAYNLQSEETITFSTNKLLLLGSFVCKRILVIDRSGIRDLTSDLPVDVEITENGGQLNANPNVLLKMKANLQPKGENHILLKHPVIIRPGVSYEICIGLFPDNHVCYAQELKSEVKVEPDIVVKFTGQKFHSHAHGLILVLNFNRL